MIVAEIMRKDVVALRAGDAIATAWRSMREQRLAVLPVTDPASHLVGVLSEGDLLARLAPRPLPRWWAALLEDDDRLAADYVKTIGVTVDDLMTVRPVATVPDASIETAASLMRRHALGALPVVASDVCLGLVTRADVLDHLPWPTDAPPGTVADTELERAMHEGLVHELWTARYRVGVEARHGIIRLTGAVASAKERAALVVMARALPGCAGVEDRLVELSSALRGRPVVFA